MLLKLQTENDINPKNLAKLEYLVNKENTLLLNHAHFCGHCHIFRPLWDEYSKKMGKKINLVEIESSALNKLKDSPKVYNRVVGKGGMVYFPMIFIFAKPKVEGKKSSKKLYEGERSIDHLNIITEALIKKPLIKKKSLKPKKKIV